MHAVHTASHLVCTTICTCKHNIVTRNINIATVGCFKVRQSDSGSHSGRKEVPSHNKGSVVQRSLLNTMQSNSPEVQINDNDIMMVLSQTHLSKRYNVVMPRHLGVVYTNLEPTHSCNQIEVSHQIRNG